MLVLPRIGRDLYKRIPRPPVLFIHGLCLASNIWEEWCARFESARYECVAPPWPGRNKSVEELRERPPEDLAELTFDDVLESYVAAAEALPVKPLIVGHSIGGLITQLLIERGLGVAGVAIASTPPRGPSKAVPSSLISDWAVLNPGSALLHPYMMPFEAFQYAYANDMTPFAQQRAYEMYVLPESLRVARGSLMESASVDFQSTHAPLLFVAAEGDRTTSSRMNISIVEDYLAGSSSVTDLQMFGGRGHLGILVGRDWELVADGVMAWMDRRMREARAEDVDLTRN